MYFLLIQNVLIANKMRTQGSKQSMIILIFQFKHSHTRRKDGWKDGPYCYYFCLNLKYPGWPYREYIKKRKMMVLWAITQWKYFWSCSSHFILLWLWRQHFWDTSEDRYRSWRFSEILFVCYSLLNSQNISKWTYSSITVKKVRLLTYLLGKLRQS